MPHGPNEPIAVRACVDQQFAEVGINQGRAVFSGMGTNGINNPNLGTDVGITVVSGSYLIIHSDANVRAQVH